MQLYWKVVCLKRFLLLNAVISLLFFKAKNLFAILQTDQHFDAMSALKEMMFYDDEISLFLIFIHQTSYHVRLQYMSIS